MAKAIHRIPILESVANGYRFLPTQFSIIMRPVIFYFVFFFVIDLIYLMQDLSTNSTAQFVKSVLLNFLFGIAIFNMARAILLKEDVRALRLDEVFSLGRISLMFKVAGFFALSAGIASFCLEQILSILIEARYSGGMLIGVAMLAYIFLIAHFTSFFAPVMAVKGLLLTYVRVAYHPLFMAKIIAIAACTILPFLLVFYLLVFSFSSSASLSLVFNSGIAWSLPQGLFWIIGKTIFMAALITTFPKFIVVPVRKKAKENDAEDTGLEDSLADIEIEDETDAEKTQKPEKAK